MGQAGRWPRRDAAAYATEHFAGIRLSFLFYFLMVPKPWEGWLGWLFLLTACRPGMDLHFFLSPAWGRRRCSISSSPRPSPVSPVLGLCLPRLAAAPGPPGSPFPGEKMVRGKCNPSYRERIVLLEADKDLQVIKPLSHSAHGETEALRGDGSP